MHNKVCCYNTDINVWIGRTLDRLATVDKRYMLRERVPLIHPTEESSEQQMICRYHTLSHSKLTILAHVLGVLVHTSPSLPSVCPANFNTMVANVCLVNRSDTNGFCLACDSCAEYGKQRKQLVYLIGRNAPLLTFVMQNSKPVYTGLNCLLEPVTDNGPIWRDLDPNSPEYSTSEASLISPDGRTPECKPFLLWQPREFIMNDFADEDRSQSFQVYCEYGGPIPSGHRAVRFRDDFPVSQAEWPKMKDKLHYLRLKQRRPLCNWEQIIMKAWDGFRKRDYTHKFEVETIHCVFVCPVGSRHFQVNKYRYLVTTETLEDLPDMLIVASAAEMNSGDPCLATNEASQSARCEQEK
ncbi:hypothetical protein CRM22_001536 [Opisthorchis felineus]|uniref:Uncharacterized protein n=1 Tax=Opisthorchis felineus TaxID=147828 RepID=A0A4S2MAD6_OPIFE|nr:hypothetical protein CRM22_001536 [Opisthorchis felineus]